MSKSSESKVPFEHREQGRVADPSRSFSDVVEPIILRRIGGFEHRIRVAHRLRASGLGLRAAHSAISELADRDWTVCFLPIDVGFTELAHDLRLLDVSLERRRAFPEPAAYIVEVRTRRCMSQRDFSAALGFDIRTLQNWEQGRNIPDSTVLLLVAMFDRDPLTVMSTLYGSVGGSITAE